LEQNTVREFRKVRIREIQLERVGTYILEPGGEGEEDIRDWVTNCQRYL
jgi:hypothetical protein